MTTCPGHANISELSNQLAEHVLRQTRENLDWCLDNGQRVAQCAICWAILTEGANQVFDWQKPQLPIRTFYRHGRRHVQRSVPSCSSRMLPPFARHCWAAMASSQLSIKLASQIFSNCDGTGLREGVPEPVPALPTCCGC